MRIFTCALEMIKEVERDLFEMGTQYQSSTVQDQTVIDDPNFRTMELCGYGYTLTNLDPANLWSMIQYSDKVNETWLNNEIEERLHGLAGQPLNPGVAWIYNAEFWQKFIRNNVFSYSYAERFQAQLPYIIRELQNKPHTRQAIMTMYDRHQDMLHWGGRDRVPCSISYQFLLREDKLVLIYNQRSCDFVKFFPSDVWLTVNLLLHVAKAIGKEPGQFIHFLGSLHAFAGDLKDKDIF